VGCCTKKFLEKQICGNPLENRFSVVQCIVPWIDAQLPNKSSQAKNVPNTGKMGDQWLSSIKLYYSKKMWNVVFNYNKNDLHHQKAFKNLHIRDLNRFIISQIAFELYAVKNAFLPPIFTFKTAITQRLFEESKNCLKVLYAVFCTFSDYACHFYCNWIQNFSFFCCNMNLIEDNHCHPFSRQWASFFAWELFLVVMYL
jgi:hypothetical protein